MVSTTFTDLRTLWILARTTSADSLTLLGSPGLPALVAASFCSVSFVFFGFMVESYRTPVAVSAPF
jgi:hypothetical protein